MVLRIKLSVPRDTLRGCLAFNTAYVCQIMAVIYSVHQAVLQMSK